MRRGFQPPPAGAAWRSYTFRPPDPVWTPQSELQALRVLLKRFDPDLDVWWSPARQRGMDTRRGRWRIVSWSPRRANWMTVMYVEGHLGQYRGLAPSTPILREVEKLAWHGRQELRELDRQIDKHNAYIESKRREELLGGVKEWAEDFIERSVGIRQTFGPGRPRRRMVKAADIRDTAHQRWLRETMGLRFMAKPGDMASIDEVRNRPGVKPF